ncbi:hypothetical protein ACWC24_37570 [Streptomyces sp. NPDC001443]
MDQLAVGAVVALIARYAEGLAGGMLDTAVTERLRRLWDTVTARFRGDPVAEGALRRLREQPGNVNRRGAVADHLQELVDADPHFAAALATLAREAEHAGGGANSVRLENTGAVALDGARVEISGGSIAAGRDARIEGTYTERTRSAE